MSRFLASLVVASVVCVATSASAQPEAGKYYRLKNVHSQRFLAIGDGGGEGAQIVQRAPGQSDRQQWQFEKVGNYFRIINRKSGQKLNVQSTEQGTPIVAKEDAKNAQFALEKKGDNFVIRSRHSGLVIDVADESTERKAPVIQYEAKDTPNQLFTLELVAE